MNILEFLGIKKAAEIVEGTVNPGTTIPAVGSLSPADNKPKELYRVGFNNAGMTTLTLISEEHGTMTLSLSQDACEQLIRMLRATYFKKEIQEDNA